MFTFETYIYSNMKRILFSILLAGLWLTLNAQRTVYGFTVPAADGSAVSMKQFKGKVLLIVNTATHCGFTPQYEELQALHEEFAARGLVILDFPCNQFGGQAPGTIAEIHSFCTGNYGIQFQQFDKIDVNGNQALPLYTYLKRKQGFHGFGSSQMGEMMHKMLLRKDADYAKKSDVKWNFTKFLVDRKGRVVQRFEPTDNGQLLRRAIEALLK